MSNFAHHGMGWMPDIPDFRDYSIESDVVNEIFENAAMSVSPLTTMRSPAKGKKTDEAVSNPALPARVDLRTWCPPIEDQGILGSCTAMAGVGLLEYFQRRAFNTHLDGSKLFLYKVTRNLLQWTGDTGAYLRTTMKAMAAFGVCPEQYWPYSASKIGVNGAATDPFEREPTGFCYQFAANYKTTIYYRLDPAGTTRANVLKNVKTNIAAGLPSMFGFSVYDSIRQANTSGKIPYPVSSDRANGGHAVVAVGYDDNLEIKHTGASTKTKGALLIRNSWGTGWGDAGYGYLPYAYITNGLAIDFWSLVRADYFNTGKF